MRLVAQHQKRVSIERQRRSRQGHAHAVGGHRADVAERERIRDASHEAAQRSRQRDARRAREVTTRDQEKQAHRFMAPSPRWPTTTKSAGCRAKTAAMVAPTAPDSGSTSSTSSTSAGGGDSAASRCSTSRAVTAARRCDSRRDALSDGIVHGASQSSSAKSSQSGTATQSKTQRAPLSRRGSSVRAAHAHAWALCGLASTATSTLWRGAMIESCGSSKKAVQVVSCRQHRASSQPLPEEQFAAWLAQVRRSTGLYSCRPSRRRGTGTG